MQLNYETHIIDFSNCEKNERHGRYGGQEGDKDGISYNDEYWIVKFPKNTRRMKGNNLPKYTTSPLSEYIGSHIYEILGFDTHKTLLGKRNDKIVVACKDFQQHLGDIAEVRTLKNGANKEIESQIDKELSTSITGDNVNLNELFIHFKLNPLLSDEKIEQHFWNMVVIDIFIDNNDRNNGNWGLLYDEKERGYKIAPVYDNGNAFYAKTNDETLEKYINDGTLAIRATGSGTIYSYDDHILTAKKMLKQDFDGLKDAIIRNVPNIERHFEDIKKFIQNIPNEYDGLEVCSDIRKDVYIKSLKIRFDELLLPVYHQLLNDIKTNTDNIHKNTENISQKKDGNTTVNKNFSDQNEADEVVTNSEKRNDDNVMFEFSEAVKTLSENIVEKGIS